MKGFTNKKIEPVEMDLTYLGGEKSLFSSEKKLLNKQKPVEKGQ